MLAAPAAVPGAPLSTLFMGTLLKTESQMAADTSESKLCNISVLDASKDWVMMTHVTLTR